MLTNRDVAYERQLRVVRILILCFIIGLVASGLTALPIHTQLVVANRVIARSGIENILTTWIQQVYEAVHSIDKAYPFIAYGTDWLAFAHFVIAIAFIGPLKDPVRNIWVIEFGLIACASIIPFAFIAGPVRGIPFFWILIDCSFGIIGGALLGICYKKVKNLERSRIPI